MVLDETAFQILRAGAFALAVAIALTLQRLAPHAKLRGSWRVNLPLWAINGAALGLLCGACACAASRWATAHGMGMLPSVGAPLWLLIAATVLCLDLVSYAWHRANHRIPFLWRFHRAHHSDPSFTVSTGVRFHPGELLLSLPLRLGAIVVLGAPVVGVLVFEVLFTAANLIEHGDIDCPSMLERAAGGVFVTPALHRHHHISRRPDLDTNFATIFSFWDRVFGTYHRSSSAERVQTGIPGLERPLSVAETLALPLTR